MNKSTQASTKQKIAIFASGGGSNYEALMEELYAANTQEAEVALLVCDRPKAYVLERAKKWGTPTFSISAKSYSTKVAFESQILYRLQEEQIDLIVLAGYMRILGDTILQHYLGKIINIHPSLLPAFPGKDAIGQALEYGVKVSGVTVHFVDAGMDTGPIISQETTRLDNDETKETLTKKIQALEHQLYPQVIQAFLRNEFIFEGGKVKWLQK